jgi:hypothetical protein
VRSITGLRKPTMGWSDCHSFIPTDFALLISANSGMNGIDSGSRNIHPVKGVVRGAAYGAPSNYGYGLHSQLDR